MYVRKLLKQVEVQQQPAQASQGLLPLRAVMLPSQGAEMATSPFK